MTTSDAFSRGLSSQGFRGGNPQEGFGGGVPASLPDEAYLTRFANEMLAQMPGSGPSGLNLGGLQPSGLQGSAPSSLAIDAPGVGAVGALSNSNLRPSAHGASIPGMAALRGVPSAIPLPGEADLRALLAPRLTSPAAAQPLPGADPATAEALALSGADAPGVGAVGGLSNSSFHPSAHGVPLPATPTPSETPMNVPPSAGGFSPSSSGSHYYFLDESRRPSPCAMPSAPQPGYDVYAVRRDFPILNQQVNGYPLIWLDNAATTQKPQAVIDRLVRFYSFENSNVHRGAHELAARSTDAYEDAREKVRGFLGASSSDEIVFVRSAT
jgi:cysteine desulfurase/selenocysteine lyase